MQSQSESHEFSIIASLESNTMKCCKYQYVNKSGDISGNYTSLHARAEHEVEKTNMYHDHDDGHSCVYISVRRMLLYIMMVLDNIFNFITITFVVSVYISASGMNRCLFIVDEIINDVMSLNIRAFGMSCGCGCYCECETESESLSEVEDVELLRDSHTQTSELE